MKKYCITFYDLNYNIITQFDTYKECAEYFNTTNRVIHCYISRRKLHFPNRKKRDKKKGIWGYLIKDNLEE